LAAHGSGATRYGALELGAPRAGGIGGLAVVEESGVGVGGGSDGENGGSEVSEKKERMTETRHVPLTVKTYGPYRKGRKAAADPPFDDLRKKAHLTKALCSSLCGTYTHAAAHS
jgi:hypothetical protein